ncbi:hypothetical protein RCL1_001734 [Eukaryota sp. TZLM3-RCL]
MLQESVIHGGRFSDPVPLSLFNNNPQRFSYQKSVPQGQLGISFTYRMSDVDAFSTVSFLDSGSESNSIQNMTTVSRGMDTQIGMQLGHNFYKLTTNYRKDFTSLPFSQFSQVIGQSNPIRKDLVFRFSFIGYGDQEYVSTQGIPENLLPKKIVNKTTVVWKTKNYDFEFSVGYRTRDGLYSWSQLALIDAWIYATCNGNENQKLSVFVQEGLSEFRIDVDFYF